MEDSSTKKMGRAKSKNPTTSKERMRKFRGNEANRDAENERKKTRSKEKKENNPLTEEEL